MPLGKNFGEPVTTHDKLNELRNDAANALSVAIGLGCYLDKHGTGGREQAWLAMMGAVQAQTQFTLACQLCVQCGHRMIEHSLEDPVRVPLKDHPDFIGDCQCCAEVGRMIAKNDDRRVSQSESPDV